MSEWVGSRVIALVALLLVSLLPAGNMPARSLDGGLIIVICTGDGPKSVARDGSDHPVSQQDHCPFGLLSAAADLTVAATAPHPIDWTDFRAPRDQRVAIADLAVVRPSARDPPRIT